MIDVFMQGKKRE